MEYKIFWSYKQEVANRGKGNATVATFTECTIERKTDQKGSIVLTRGMSVCRPGDNFSKREGRKRSFKRAVDLIKHDKELRTNLWNQFIEMSPKSLKKVK